jgi:hypothetical protein
MAMLVGVRCTVREFSVVGSPAIVRVVVSGSVADAT